MKRLNQVLENRTIGNMVRHFGRSPLKINKLHETDAELIDLGRGRSHVLAITIDTIADEISEGLYRDPFTMGWVTVMANLSDLAAVGAEPIGIVTAVSLERSRSEEFRRRIALGMEKACRRTGTFILGGDLNFTRSISLTGCAIGRVPRNMKLARIGCQEGDVIFLSGRTGGGNALGLARKTQVPDDMYPERSYRPVARIQEALLLRKYASCCMDTSDGLFITVDQLVRLNGRGFSIYGDWKTIFKRDAIELCEKLDIPFWFLAAGIHGEFELLFTVPFPKVPSFLREAKRAGFHPISLGKITDSPAFEILLDSGKSTKIDMTPLRNLWEQNTVTFDQIVAEHFSLGKVWGLN